jgi:hypothetical protein
MSAKPIKLETSEERKYRRLMLRSLFSSLFWGVVAARKRREGFLLQSLANATGRDKSQVSRWFSSNPNWTLDTIADVAQALDLELQIEARERSTGMIFTPYGPSQTIGQKVVTRTAPVRMMTLNPTVETSTKAA